MFKTDQETLEALSFEFGVEDIANLRATLTYLESKDLLTVAPGVVRDALKALDAIGKLKLDGKVYAFHVDDSYAVRQTGEGEGVELHLRQGNIKRFFCSRK